MSDIVERLLVPWEVSAARTDPKVAQSQREAAADEIVRLRAERDRLRDALTFYASPEVYKPHPHGLGFDDRDLSYVAVAALKGDTQ